MKNKIKLSFKAIDHYMKRIVARCGSGTIPLQKVKLYPSPQASIDAYLERNAFQGALGNTPYKSPMCTGENETEKKTTKDNLRDYVFNVNNTFAWYREWIIPSVDEEFCIVNRIRWDVINRHLQFIHRNGKVMTWIAIEETVPPGLFLNTIAELLQRKWCNESVTRVLLKITTEMYMILIDKGNY